ncbi:hypothetical protein BDV98DRAFT_569955 [Pterulicium gracile]|uniref:Uncharacterized protein n=1 Tax=Pterulicium gracile TaxID=1884261 RepID=A0A5C3QEW6_9AGAR|nr:hypothetical protein BDV98DRAFT_569955 [Pterula gracilis]
MLRSTRSFLLFFPRSIYAARRQRSGRCSIRSCAQEHPQVLAPPGFLPTSCLCLLSSSSSHRALSPSTHLTCLVRIHHLIRHVACLSPKPGSSQFFPPVSTPVT